MYNKIVCILFLVTIILSCNIKETTGKVENNAIIKNKEIKNSINYKIDYRKGADYKKSESIVFGWQEKIKKADIGKYNVEIKEIENKDGLPGATQLHYTFFNKKNNEIISQTEDLSNNIIFNSESDYVVSVDDINKSPNRNLMDLYIYNIVTSKVERIHIIDLKQDNEVVGSRSYFRLEDILYTKDNKPVLSMFISFHDPIAMSEKKDTYKMYLNDLPEIWLGYYIFEEGQFIDPSEVYIEP